MKRLGCVEAETGTHPVLLFKDVGEADRGAARRALAPLGFREVPVDPIMVLAIRPEWRRFEDYLAALRARYRGHARQALRASAGIERRELDSAEIAGRAADIDRLHAAVVARAAVRPSWLDARGFAALRARLGDGFSLVGYFDGGHLIAFNTRFHGGSDLESHYFGLDYAVSRRYALYRTMLYDDIGAAIDRGARRVLFGRMSCELKSTLGAVPHAMSWFGKSRSPWITGALAHVIQRLRPDGVLHDPFRA
jgi:predicted N-acyltransferase